MSDLPPPPPPPHGSGSPVPPPPPPPSGYPAPPSGYPAPPATHPGPEHGYVGQYHQGFQPVGRNARTMVILLGLIGAMQVIGIPVQIALHDKSEKFLAGSISKDTFESALRTQQNVAGVQAGATIAVAILTMLWMRKLINNHRLLGRPDSRWGPGWAIGGWFVPPGAIYAVPWLIFKELWKGSDPANVPNDPGWKRRPVSPLIHVWWVLYGFVPIVGAAINAGGGGLASLRDMTKTDDLDLAKLYTEHYGLQLAVGAVGVIATFVFAKLVHDLTRRQRALTGEG